MVQCACILLQEVRAAQVALMMAAFAFGCAAAALRCLVTLAACPYCGASPPYSRTSIRQGAQRTRYRAAPRPVTAWEQGDTVNTSRTYVLADNVILGSIARGRNAFVGTDGGSADSLLLRVGTAQHGRFAHGPVVIVVLVAGSECRTNFYLVALASAAWRQHYLGRRHGTCCVAVPANVRC